jgi:predicted cupin superfamily sugar epimerase
VEAEAVIRALQLTKNIIEGGYYRETYRSTETYTQDALPSRYQGNRQFSTSIYYLITEVEFSAFHRLTTDEVYHFYAGDSVNLCLINDHGHLEQIALGPDLLSGEVRQAVVPRGVWQGSYIENGGRWALLGCTVSPAFEFSDYEHGDRIQLLREFPGQAELIVRLTRVD